MNPLQRAAVRRKATYLAVILGLFTVSMLWRGMVPIPLAGKVQAADRVAAGTILSQSQRLELRELEQGTPDLTGEAVRLAFVGSRGFLVTWLWYDAIDQQKRNDFHKLEQSVQAVTTLQPHFITPWIFQSWNIAYNVSVEMHSLGDMYFYIARGIELLSEGERRNKRSPDMRYQIAFYYQNKFGVSDQVQTLRCLFQLSCIPPADWNPDNLLAPDGSVDLRLFRQFCERHPMLVRRLRGEERRERDKQTTFEGLRARRPEDVVQFLRDNRRVPTRYKNATDLAAADRQFPALPPQFNEGPDEKHPGSSAADLGDTFSGFLAARAWFTYANAIVPPAARDPDGNPVPSGTPQPLPAPGGYDPFVYRVPRLPMLIIFKQGPPRAQTYQADLMQKDGWFDGSGWEVDAGIDDSNAWFTENGRKPATPVVVGAGQPWSQAAWQEAARMWDKHGRENGLVLDEARKQRYREDLGLPAGGRDDALPYPGEETPEMRADPAADRRFRAHSALFYYHSNRHVTNFPFYLASSEAEQKTDTVQARKTLWQADQARRVGNKVQAIELYQRGLDLWKRVLLDNPSFHRGERFDRTEEETVEFELEYVRLIADADKRVWDKAKEEYAKLYAAAAPAAFGAAAFAVATPPAPREVPDSLRPTLYAETAEKFFSPFRDPMPVIPGDPRSGGPWVQEHIRNAVLQRQGVSRTPPPSPDQGPPGAGGPPGGPPGR
jgi:hypothetical protein